MLLNAKRDDHDDRDAPAGEDDRSPLPALLRLLDRRGYDFVTPTPATHARVIARDPDRRATCLEDVFGWSRPFVPGSIDREVERLLRDAGMVAPCGNATRSRIRVSRLHGRLFLHSAYPTDDEDAVFFGPDSYRFADLVRAELPDCPSRPGAQIVDIGTGSGVGAIVAATACPQAIVRMTDVNPAALRFARFNAAAAGIRAETFETKGLAAVPGDIDIALANPPFIIDAANRTYRDGGGMHGAEVSLEMTREAMARLAPNGRLILYTGSAIVGGRDALRHALDREAAAAGMAMRYRELDPDIFGEELENPAYADVDRIALIAAVIERPA